MKRIRHKPWQSTLQQHEKSPVLSLCFLHCSFCIMFGLPRPHFISACFLQLELQDSGFESGWQIASGNVFRIWTSHRLLIMRLETTCSTAKNKTAKIIICVSLIEKFCFKRLYRSNIIFNNGKIFIFNVCFGMLNISFYLVGIEFQKKINNPSNIKV